MNHQDADKGIRPGFLILLACVLAVILIPLGLLWKSQNKPPQANETAEATATGVPAAVTTRAADAKPVATARPSPLEVQWGIQIAGLELAIGGSAVDLRYKVVDPEKAALLAECNTAPYLIDQASGAKIPMTPSEKEGAFPQRSRARMARQAGAFPPSPNRLMIDKINSILFPNLDRKVRSGSKVVLVLGNSRTDALTVE
jgi:hypothetical protein